MLTVALTAWANASPTLAGLLAENMRPIVDDAEARELAEEYLAAMEQPRDDVWVVTTVQERDWGWIVTWLNSRAAQGSTGSENTHAGIGPFLIDRKTGRVALCSSAHPVEDYINAWHGGELAEVPRPA